MSSPAGTVTIERDGRRYSARFAAAKGLVAVTGRYGCRAARLAGLRPDRLAAILLGEMVRELHVRA